MDDVSEEENGQAHTNLIQLLKSEKCECDVTHGDALKLPTWFCKEKFKNGQKFFQDNFFSLFVSNLSGLIIVLSIPSILRILVMTKKSAEPVTAFRRYVLTIAHMLSWYNGDITLPGSRAAQSLRQVYLKHVDADKKGKKHQIGSVSQKDLSLTQFGFMGFAMVCPEKLGIKTDDEEGMEGFVHFWRTIGHLVGIQDQYNLCRETVKETKEICTRVLEEVFKPNLEEKNKDFIRMTKALLDGMWSMVPQIDFEAFVCFTYKLCNLEFENTLNWYSRSVLVIQTYVHEVLLLHKLFGRIWRAYFNFQMWLSVVITMRFPFLAYYSFGFSSVKSFQHEFLPNSVT